MAALEAKDDACKFLIMDIVVFFRREEAPQVEGDWVACHCRVPGQ